MADAISHTVLLGIVVAYMVTRELSGVHMLIGAVIAGLLTSVLVQWFHSRGVQQEASIGVVFTTLFAIGVVLIATQVGNAHLDIKHALMGRSRSSLGKRQPCLGWERFQRRCFC